MQLETVIEEQLEKEEVYITAPEYDSLFGLLARLIRVNVHPVKLTVRELGAYANCPFIGSGMDSLTFTSVIVKMDEEGFI